MLLTCCRNSKTRGRSCSSSQTPGSPSSMPGCSTSAGTTCAGAALGPILPLTPCCSAAAFCLVGMCGPPPAVRACAAPPAAAAGPPRGVGRPVRHHHGAGGEAQLARQFSLSALGPRPSPCHCRPTPRDPRTIGRYGDKRPFRSLNQSTGKIRWVPVTEIQKHRVYHGRAPARAHPPARSHPTQAA